MDLIDGRRRMADGGRPYRGFVAALIAACLIAIPLRAQESGIPVGSVAPGAKLESLDGKAAELSQYIGKLPVVMEFWATW